MKKYVLLSAMIAVLTIPGIAWSQAATAPAATAPAAKHMDKGSFSDHKQKAIAHANDKIAEWQKRLACAQAATTADALKACKPAKKPSAQ